MSLRNKLNLTKRPKGYKPPKDVRDNRLLDQDRKKELISEFDKIDVNNDGILTKKEIEDFMKKNLKIKGIGKSFATQHLT